jgi:CheY-like chemotaxis protein
MSYPVLVVDDDHDIVSGVGIRLRAAGYKTLAAYDGQQGVAAAIRYAPDVILLDVRMPTMDGLAALGKLKETPSTRDIPVVMLSASLMDQQKALDAGALFFIQKPYSPENLLAVLDTAINGGKPAATSSGPRH